jgi:uncharacterized membrane protein YgaE (UPF0421/DUF939 family)
VTDARAIRLGCAIGAGLGVVFLVALGRVSEGMTPLTASVFTVSLGGSGCLLIVDRFFVWKEVSDREWAEFMARSQQIREEWARAMEEQARAIAAAAPPDEKVRNRLQAALRLASPAANDNPHERRNAEAAVCKLLREHPELLR